VIFLQTDYKTSKYNRLWLALFRYVAKTTLDLVSMCEYALQRHATTAARQPERVVDLFSRR